MRQNANTISLRSTYVCKTPGRVLRCCHTLERLLPNSVTGTRYALPRSNPF